MPPATTRRLKVSSHYARLRPRLKIMSSLRLTGDWLLHAGFHRGDIAAIEVTTGRLTITKA